LTLAATTDEIASVGRLHFGEVGSGTGCKGICDSEKLWCGKGNAWDV